MDSCLRLGGWRLLRGIWLQKATMSATMRHLNPLWCPQLTHKVCAPAGRLGLAERAHGLVLEPREQALGVKEVATGRDAARPVELVSANRAARAHGPTNRHLLRRRVGEAGGKYYANGKPNRIQHACLQQRIQAST